MTLAALVTLATGAAEAQTTGAAASASSVSNVSNVSSLSKTKSPGCAAAVRWTTDPKSPLATVLDGKIVAKRDPCAGDDASEFLTDGLAWSAVDRFGQKVGVVTRKTDAKGVAHFVGAKGGTGAKLFVRAPAGMAFVSYEWVGSADDRKNLLVALELEKVKDVTFFEAGERFAIVTTRHALTIVRKAGKKGWLRVHRDIAEDSPVTPYTLRAVVDVDGDGFPEVIEHVADGGEGAGWDVVLRRDGKGAWNPVASSGE